MDTSMNLEQVSFRELEEYIRTLPEKQGALITVLHKAQAIFGYLPKEVQVFVAEGLKLPVSKVYGVVQFYSFFTMTPKGKHRIAVCMGTACYVKGAEKVLDRFKKILAINEGETTTDGRFSLEALRCVGACGLAPVVVIDDQVYGKVTPKKVTDILAIYQQGGEET